MDVALLALRLLLSAVFAIAGIAKLADRTGSARMVRGFGLPAPWAPALGLFLPLAELVTALALIPVSSARYGALAALGLLVAFSVAIGANLVRGRTPDCHCFGQIHSAPAGWATLARNGALAVAAAFVAWQGWSDPGPSALGWLGTLTVSERAGLLSLAVVLVLIVAQTWLLVQLLAQNGRILMRLDALESGFPPDAEPATHDSPEPDVGLPIGAPAPSFALADLDGETLSLDALRALGKSIVLVFSDTGCGPCNALLPDLGRWQHQHAKELTLVVVNRGRPETIRAQCAKHALGQVLFQRKREVMESYRAYGTPSAVVVQADGAIGSPLAQGPESIRALVARTAVSRLS
jgi:peroxiredoxin